MPLTPSFSTLQHWSSAAVFNWLPEAEEWGYMGWARGDVRPPKTDRVQAESFMKAIQKQQYWASLERWVEIASAYYSPNTILSNLYILFHLISLTNSFRWHICNSHSADEETGQEKLSNLSNTSSHGVRCKWVWGLNPETTFPWLFTLKCRIAQVIQINKQHLEPDMLQSVQVGSVAQPCLTLCDPMVCSTPGLPVHHQLPEFTQTHV